MYSTPLYSGVLKGYEGFGNWELNVGGDMVEISCRSRNTPIVNTEIEEIGH